MGMKITKEILKQAIAFAESNKRSFIDLDNHVIVIPLDRGLSKAVYMQEGMLGDWFEKNGFSISWSHGDYEYNTQSDWRNSYGWNRSSGHKAILRDRDIATITWES